MSSKSTELTQSFFTKELQELNAVGSFQAAWEVQDDLRLRMNDLSEKGMIDHNAITEIAEVNAEKYGLDTQRAGAIFKTQQKASPDGKLRPMWEGTGNSLASVGTEIVHYLNNPGRVEELYGPALPYVVDKLTWLALANAEKGFTLLDNKGGYQYVTERLNRNGRKSNPHIGSAITQLSDIRPTNDELKLPKSIIASASGTLMNAWADGVYQAVPQYAERAVQDEAAGLYDGHIENRRAGLYDVVFATMQAKALYGLDQNGKQLEVPNPDKYKGVDIN